MRIVPLFVLLLLASTVPASASPEEEPTGLSAPHLATFGKGAGPRVEGGVYHLLDADRSKRQSNAIAFDRQAPQARERVTVRFQLRVDRGGDGGAFALLNTREYGARGPAPFVKSWVEPNLRKSFAVGIDVHNPPNREPFGPWGNYQSLPQREVSLHWDGREIVKRVAAIEFRDKFSAGEIDVAFVTGGAEVTVRFDGTPVYDRFFIAHMHAYPTRLAIGAGTRADALRRQGARPGSRRAGPPAAAPLQGGRLQPRPDEQQEDRVRGHGGPAAGRLALRTRHPDARDPRCREGLGRVGPQRRHRDLG